MALQWLGYAEKGERRAVAATLERVSPGSVLRCARSASELRQTLHDEEPRAYGAVVGPCGEGISDINLAAALAHDGHAREVLLLTREISGSLTSRALKAGITRVVVLADEVPIPAVPKDAVQPRPESQPGSGSGPGMSRGAARPSAAREDSGSLITLVSGRGGVGKTTLCALMAALAASWGMRVALLDLDLSCGNLASLFPSAMGSDLSELASLPPGSSLSDELRRRAVPCLKGVDLWGPCAKPELAECAMPVVGPVLAELRQAYDLVLVDTSSTCTDAVAQAMQAADRLVCVQGCGTGAVASLARTSALAVRLGVARTRIVRVESRCDPRLMRRPPEPSVEIGLETARTFRVVEGTPEVLEAIASGSIEELSALEDDLSRSVATLLAALLHELGCLPEADDAERAAKGELMRKPFSLFGRRREAV